MLAAGDLEQGTPSAQNAAHLLAETRGHLPSGDPEGMPQARG